MFQGHLLKNQIKKLGVRIGDGCNILPFDGRKKAFTLNRYCIDIVSSHYRPIDLSMTYFELSSHQIDPFHYRLELDKKSSEEGRFVLKTIKGEPFSLNGLIANEAYVERSDRVYIDNHKMNFQGHGLRELTDHYFEHPILQMRNLVESDLNILIQGETGTGKTHLAKKIHEASGKQGRFVAVNLSSYNISLLESELFGHAKGAFTGAHHERTGAFSLANEGTLFLDEIDSLPYEIQTKLLTFLDNKVYRRVGDSKEQKIKSRLIFAAGRPLEKLVSKGEVRKDFYFRLKSGHSIELNSLRSDSKKILETLQFYGLKYEISFSPRLQDFYQTLAWPGNLRQLLGHLDKKRILTRTSKIDFDDLDEELMLKSSDLMSFAEDPFLSMEDCKKNHLSKTLAACNGNISLTAKKLRLAERTVRSLVQKINLQERK